MEGHLTCIQATPFDSFIVGDPFGGVYALPQMVAQIREEEEADRAEIESRLVREGVSWDWLSFTGSAAKVLIDNARLSDLVLVSPTPSDGDPETMPPPIAADVALHSQAPVLVVPAEAEGFDCFGPAIVAWDGSFEAAQALRSALPLLRLADSTTLVTIAEKESAFPPTDASTYLSRHGITSELVERTPDEQSVASALRAEFARRNGSYLVLGAYGHSRLRERLLGGVTRSMLEECHFPLLLAH
ncbi:MAG: universal stress protein [Parasphingopyxis sp.]